MANPQLDIVGNDFVTVGTSKFNEAIKYLPMELKCTPEGILTVLRYGKPALTVNLGVLFPTRLEVFAQLMPGDATLTKKGIVQLGDDTKADDLASESLVLPAAAVMRLIDKIDLESLVDKTEAEVLDRFLSVAIDAASDTTIQKLCNRLATIGCGGANGKLVSYIRVEGPNSFPKNQTRTFKIRAYYSDDTNAIVGNGLFSVQGTDIAVNEQTGLVTPGPNAVVGGAYKVVGNYLGKTHTKDFTLTASAIAWTRRNVPPRFFEPVGLLGPNIDGSLDQVNCDMIIVWIADLNHPNIPQEGLIYINGILAKRFTANLPRPDVSQVLNLANTTGHIYEYRFPVPNAFRTGQPLTVELKPVSGSNAMRYSPKTSAQGCLDLSNLINVAAGKSVTATNQEGGDSTWSPLNLTDENAATNYSSTCLQENDALVFTVDLNGTASPQQIKISRRNGDGPLPVAYIIDGSVDNVGWFRMVTVNNQASGNDEVVLPVEKNIEGQYRPVRYVRFTSVTNVMIDCYRVQLAEFKVMAPSLTPIGQEPPTRQPSKILILGDQALNEGNSIDLDVTLIYTNNDDQDVTGDVTFSVTGVAVTLERVQVNGKYKLRLTAADDGTTTPSRQVVVKVNYPGLQATKDIIVWNATVTDYVKSQRIDWNTAAENLTEGTNNTVRITNLKNSGATEQYTGAGSYSIIAPYPDGMTITTGANAIGTLNLPSNSITANLNITIRFTFPAGGGFIEKSIPLVNVNDTPVTFSHYEIDGDATLPESNTQSVTKNYVVNGVYSDESRAPYLGAGLFSADTPFPNGMSITNTANGNGSITLPANSIVADVPITLRFTFPDNYTITKVVTLQNVGCTPTSNAIDADVITAGSNAYSVQFYFRTLSGQPWKYRLNNFSWNDMDGLSGGIDANCYQFGVSIGPVAMGETVTVRISPDGVNNIITRTLTVNGVASRTNLYSGS